MKIIHSIIGLTLLSSTLLSCTEERTVSINIVETSDVHGNFYPFNFIENKEWSGSLARVQSFLEQQRATYGENCLYIDNGDILQGQPTVYYYNYIDTTSMHIVPAMLNYMGCNVGNVGNHDVETGHAVYDRVFKQFNCPVLGANIIDTKTGEPYLKPYEVFERDGVKIAVFGLLTPAIPSWLPEGLWKGLRFEDMVTSAQKWVKIINENENPDILVGLFHAGQSGSMLGDVCENASRMVAEQVPGFDVVFFGHDHKGECTKILNNAGDSVLLIDPANNANLVGNVVINVTKKGDKLISKEVKGNLEEMKNYAVNEKFMQQFAGQFDTIKNFVSERIGHNDRTMSSNDALFGPCEFMGMIHKMQLDITGADVSFTAPLSMNATVKEGDIFVYDMFNLYKYENMLYVMELTGKEIKGYLEMSYALWTNQMRTPNDHILLLNDVGARNERGLFKNMSFNFDSASGIIYTVDVTKPEGEKITITSMADGTPFEMNKTYKCAINSYRGNGGGDLLVKGAGIDKEDLTKRIVFSTDKDLRFYLMNYIKECGEIHPRTICSWKFIPESWASKAIKRDKTLLNKSH